MGGLGVGGAYSCGADKYALFGEVLVNTGLENFGDSYNVTAPPASGSGDYATLRVTVPCADKLGSYANPAGGTFPPQP